jgi:type II secretory pathway pseudopilin PulG
LPFLALAVLLPNWRSFRYTAEEKRALAVGALFLLLLLALFTYAARQVR